MTIIAESCGYNGYHISYYFEKNNINFIGIDNLAHPYNSIVFKKQRYFYIDTSNINKLKNIKLQNANKFVK